MPLITVANVNALVTKTAFNPVLTGLLYWLRNYLVETRGAALTAAAASLSSLSPAELLRALLARLVVNPQTASVLKYLAIFGVVRYANSWLNHLALNNYTGLFDKFEPADEIAVVTGGASGIGALTVQGLAAAGFKKVVVLDIQGLTYPAPENVAFFRVDLTSGEDIDAVADKVRAEVGHPTVVINNAGTGIGKTILGSTERSIKLTFNVNSVAPFLVTKAFLPNMIAQNHGHVVTIASLASFTTPAQMVDYAASKAAALAFSEGLSQELKHRYQARGVRNTVVHPMWVKTPLTHVFNNLDHFLANQLEPEQVSDAVVKQVLTGRSAQLCIPSSLGFSAVLRALPNWLQEKMRDDQQDMIVVNKDF